MLTLPARGGHLGGGRGFRLRGVHGGARLLHHLGPYPYLTIALVVLVVAGVVLYLRSRR